MTPQERKVMELALEALEDRASLMKWQIARDAVKEVLAQPEQEPVAWCSMCGRDIPPPRKPLTDEQIEALLVNWPENGIAFFEFARAIEAAHGIKGKA